MEQETIQMSHLKTCVNLAWQGAMWNHESPQAINSWVTRDHGLLGDSLWEPIQVNNTHTFCSSTFTRTCAVQEKKERRKGREKEKKKERKREILRE